MEPNERTDEQQILEVVSPKDQAVPEGMAAVLVPVNTLPMLTLEQLLGVDDRPITTMAIPEWNGCIKIQGMSKAQQIQIREQATIGGQLDQGRLEILTLISGVVEPQLSLDVYAALAEKNGMVIDRINNAIMTASGVTPEVIAEAQKRLSLQS